MDKGVNGSAEQYIIRTLVGPLFLAEDSPPRTSENAGSRERTEYHIQLNRRRLYWTTILVGAPLSWDGRPLAMDSFPFTRFFTSFLHPPPAPTPLCDLPLEERSG